jgi:hypothetical protein
MLESSNNNKEASLRGKKERDISLLGGIVDILDDPYKSTSPTDSLGVASSTSRRPSSAGSSSGKKETAIVKKPKKESKKVKQTSEETIPESEIKALMDRLCLNENGFDLINERIKLSLNNTKEAALFLRKRATVEEEYAAKVLKIVNSSVRPDQDKG